MLDQDSSFYLICLNILITCFLKNVWILKGEDLCLSLLGVKGLMKCILNECCKSKAHQNKGIYQEPMRDQSTNKQTDQSAGNLLRTGFPAQIGLETSVIFLHQSQSEV